MQHIENLLLSYLHLLTLYFRIFFQDKFHAVIKSKYYQKPKSNVLSFAIHHFAGRVVYNADGFLEKNKNFLPPEVVQLIRGSQYDT